MPLPLAQAIASLGTPFFFWSLEETPIEICCLVPFGQEAPMAARLLALPGTAPRLANAAAFAIRYRVLLLTDAAGTPIDISFGALPLEESALRRAESISGVPVATIEDRLLQLLWRARPGDWERVRSLVRQHRTTLQWPYLDFWAPELAAAKDDSQMLDAYQAARQQALNSH